MDRNGKVNRCTECYVGTNLESRIPRIFKSRGCNCDRTRDEINSLTPEQCEERFDNITDLLVANAKKYVIPEMLARPKAEKWLRESIDQAKEARSAHSNDHQDLIREVRKGRSLSNMLRPVRLQRGQQGIPPEDGNLPG